MKITLKPEQERFIQTQINSGKFTNADQVIDLAFQLLEKLNTEYQEWIIETRQKVDIAITELDNGEGLDGETVVNDILDRFKQARGEN
ncbi:MAG: ribbon-helix-helix domain-containing protein [Planktothrix sp.]